MSKYCLKLLFFECFLFMLTLYTMSLWYHYRQFTVVSQYGDNVYNTMWATGTQLSRILCHLFKRVYLKYSS